MRPPILLNLVFFVVLSLVGGSDQYLVVGLQALHGTPPAVGNTALTGLLAMSAVGVLVGGALAARTGHHQVVASAGLLAMGAANALIALTDPGAVLLILVVSLSGFASGITMPSRDMIVRSVTAGIVRQGVRLRHHRLHIGVVAPVIGQLPITAIRAQCSCSSPPARWWRSPRSRSG